MIGGQNIFAMKTYIMEESCTGKLHLPQMFFIIHREWIKPHGFPRSISVLSVVAGQGIALHLWVKTAFCRGQLKELHDISIFQIDSKKMHFILLAKLTVC